MKKVKIKMIDSVNIKLAKAQFRVMESHKFDSRKISNRAGLFIDSVYIGKYREELKRRGRYFPVLHKADKKVWGNEVKGDLEIQVSLPKLIYGTNYCEIDLDDIDKIYKKLTSNLFEIGIKTSEAELKQAIIRQIDFSKVIKLPDYLGKANQVVYTLSRFDYKPQSEFRWREYDNGSKGAFMQFYNTTQRFTIYDKLGEILNTGYTEIEKGIIGRLKEGKIKRNALKFELSLQLKHSLEALLRRRIDGKKKDFTLDDVFNIDLARNVLIDVFDKVFNDIAFGLISLGEMEENKLRAYFDNRELRLRKQEKLYYWVNLATKFGEAGTWEELKRKCRGGSVATNKNQISKILVELGRIDGKTPNLISFLRQELSEFKVIKPLSTEKHL